MHDVIALLNPVPSNDIAKRVSLGVTHVKIARRVREHVQNILLRSFVVGLARIKGLELIPNRQPLIR
jgi:hypothetical protein